MAKEKLHAVADGVPQLDDFLCFAVYSANLAFNRLYKPLLEDLNLTYPQYLVLVALADEDNQTVGGLGSKLFLDSSTLTPLLKRMEGVGYLTRQRDPEDERQVRIRLTPEGRRIREAALCFRGGLLMATGLTPAAFAKLREDLVTLRDNLTDAARVKP
ncbi:MULTISPECIES: MarR family transcriptional regulator [Rhodomicrobium]|uniref:MarR family winged helix-turn-helix transcriptional regulator n=1 Tax=Rhodomicrobium TaxID=1068 RepID=UPI000B4B7E09|nr:MULTISPECIES: MarR family transcriptional regulator [Rhodomicrobium]